MNKPEGSEAQRKRGRPAGKNRVPLTITERRARNAQYERERRVELNEALAELAEAAGCESTISNADLLDTVKIQFQRAAMMNHSSDIDCLRRCNKLLMAQVETLEKRLSGDPDAAFPQTKEEDESPCYGKRKRYVYEAASRTSFTPRPADSPPVDEYSSPESAPEQKHGPTQPFSLQVFEPEIQITEQKYPAEQKFVHENFSAAATSTSNCLPVPKHSPVSYSSDCNSPEQSLVDFSSYQFAGSQIPTPEYQITADLPEYAMPEPVYSSYQGHYRHEVSPTGHVAQLSPTVQHSLTAHTMISGLQYPVPYIRPPLPNFDQAPVDHTVVGSQQVPEQALVGTPQIDPIQIRFLSTEDLISVYL